MTSASRLMHVLMRASRALVMGLTLMAGLLSALPAQAQTWSGAYFGGFAGFGFQSTDDAESIGFDKDLNGTFTDTIVTVAGVNAFSPGFCGGAANGATPAGSCVDDDDSGDFGVRGGYDWQFGRFVIGGLGEVSRAQLTDSVSAFSTTPAFYTFTRELELLASARARAGFGGERAMAYGTGGVVWGRLDNRFSTSNTANTFVQSDDDSAWGYQAGGGVEVRVAGRWTLSGEYLFTELRDQDRYSVRAQGPAAATNPFLLTNAAGTDFQRSERFEFSSARVGVNYRF